jgi:hypothetical protein
MSSLSSFWEKPLVRIGVVAHIAAALALSVFTLASRHSFTVLFAEVLVPFFCASVLAMCVLFGLKSGVLPGRYGTSVSRAQNPMLFWSAVCTYSGLAIMFAYLFVRTLAAMFTR